MAISEEVAKLCRLCMTTPASGEMTQIFQEHETSSVFCMKIMSTLGVEVRKVDQLPKQMCTPCVYQLEKLYMFRKMCRKNDSKYRSFVRKVKSKKIRRLSELSDDEDDAENDAGETNQKFVQEYERWLLEDKANAQAANGRQELLTQIKRTLYEAIDNLTDEQCQTTEAPQVDQQLTPQKSTARLTNSPKTPVSSFRPSLPRHPRRKKFSSIANPPPNASESDDDDDEDDDNNEEDEEKLKMESVLSQEELSLQLPEDDPPDYDDDDEDAKDLAQNTSVVLKTGLNHKCKSCHRKFSSVEELEKHQLYHASEKNVCPDCGKCFSASGSLFRHMKIHKEVKPFICEICDKGFTQKSSMQRHALVHQSDRPFPCSQCDRTFSQKNLLLEHVSKTHSGSTVTYLFRCGECPKTFRHSSGLSRHSLIHSGKQPFSCGTCQKKLADYSSLQRHIKLVHKDKEEQDEN